VQTALDASESKNTQSQWQIADLGQRLNVALAQRVEELTPLPLDFFGRLNQILATARHHRRGRPLRVPVRGLFDAQHPRISADLLGTSATPAPACQRIEPPEYRVGPLSNSTSTGTRSGRPRR